MNHKKPSGNQSSPSNKMSEAEKADIYVMVTTNCKHRPPIKEMLAKVRELRAALDSYESKNDAAGTAFSHQTEFAQEQSAPSAEAAAIAAAAEEKAAEEAARSS